ncbi:MAG TPA: hypothetical protein VMH00_15040 [Candidatus Limnocylindrales bacterium]|nr:hypothetical protein [Candidatus Limnocylindrales bacterium]
METLRQSLASVGQGSRLAGSDETAASGSAVRMCRAACGFALLVAAGLAFIVAPAARAQSQAASDDGQQGMESGNYNVQQTIEFGYRWSGINGNMDTYDTFVNLGSGFRLLDYTLDMRSLNHQGIFFDDLNFSNFGYGGDPNDVSRLHIDKNKWYDFHMLFRRDKNFWDYNLLANPFNPAALNPGGSATTGCIVSPPTSANPGLPGFCSNPAIAAANSPHGMDLVRRMQDYDLTLLPRSRVRFRVGFSHYRDEGPGFFTTDSGTVPDFPENYSYTSNAWRAGVDFRILPRTTISYDQFLNYFKQDNNVLESPAATPGLYGYQLANGTPVDMGIVWSTQTPAEALPCAAPIANSATTPATVNPVCNGFLGYSQVGRPRNFMPTERVRFQSDYFAKFEMSGGVGYSNSNNVIPDYNEILNGYTTRTATRESTTGGPVKTTRVSVNADWTGVYAVTDKVRVEDSFRYDNWRIPGMWATAETNLFGGAASGQAGLALPLSLFTESSPSTGTAFASLCPAAPYNQAGCPLHTSSSGADVTNELSYQFLGQNLKSNTLQVEYDFAPRWTARIGYLYTNRAISEFSATFDTGETYFPGGATAAVGNDYLAARGDCALVAGVLPAGCVLNADGSITEGSPSNPVAEAGNDTARDVTTISENSLLFGFTGRPVDQLRITGDFSFGYNDASFTRIDPRQVQSYKLHASYAPKPWASIDGSVEIHENRDDVYQVDNLEHDRMYSVTTMLMPSPRLAVSFGYNYWDMYTQADICFNYSITYTNPAPPPTTLPVSTSPPGVATTACPISGASVGAAGLGALSTYSSNDHFAHADVMWKPVKRVTAALGYGGSFVRGNTIFLNPLMPSGTLDYNYQMPYGSLTIDISKGFSYKMAWNYYGFNQIGNTSPFGLAAIPLQDFNGSNATFSFRYAF